MGALFGRSDRPDPARSGALEDLLGDMEHLRLTLAADLTAAAGAADVGAEDVARDILESDRQELARFARVANLRLERLSHPRRDVHVWRRRAVTALPVVPVVGAIALSAAAATGVLQLPGTHHRPAHEPVVAAGTAGPVTTFKQLVSVLNSDPSASQVIAAANQLHRQLRHLIATSPNDPAQAAEVARLLRMEQSLLLREQPPGASIVLNATRKLAERLVTVVPAISTPSALPTFVPTAQPSPHRSHHVMTSNGTRPTTSPTPQPSSSPKPSPSPSNSPDASPSPSGAQFPRLPH